MKQTKEIDPKQISNYKKYKVAARFAKDTYSKILIDSIKHIGSIRIYTGIKT